MPLYIRGLSVRDIRFPGNLLDRHVYEAQNSEPDFSLAYVVLFTSRDTKGFGYTFTYGQGTGIVVEAVKTLSPMIVGQEVTEIFNDFAAYWKRLVSDSQIRWLGPEKGVVHMAAGAIINALWDLWGRLENKPVWKLLVDMSPEQLVSTIDFSYISDALTKEEALDILTVMQTGKERREEEMMAWGYPSYTNSGGSLGYRNEQIKRRLNYAINHGFTKFKIKVGKSLEDDKRRLAVVRDVIGWDRELVLNANQCWEVDEAIAWIKELKDFKPMWIEEPTSPDDVLGHGKISLAVNPLGIKVATGQHCQNRVLFKQFFQTNAMQVCEVDACRLAGVNEVLAVMLMAKKYNVPVCPSAGGVGLCEMIQHIAIFDYISVSGTVEGRVAEYSDFLHDHFMHPIRLRNAHYQAPTAAGFCTEMLEESTINFEYPKGWKWKELFEEGVYQDPRNSKPKHIQHFGIAPHRVPSATHYQLF